jgi:hypothetical protein
MISRITEQWILFFSALEADGWFREDLVSDQVILVFIFMPILRDAISDWVEDHNAALIRPQRHRSLHVPGIPNDLYRGSPDAPKQGFDFDHDLHNELEKQVLNYSTFPLVFLCVIKANSALDPDEYLTTATLRWCQQQLAQLGITTPPVTTDFISSLDNFRVPDYYKSLVRTARLHHNSEKEPRLKLAAKPYGGYG